MAVGKETRPVTDVVRCAALLRVSTARQVSRGGDDDLPLQQEAIREFVARRPGWTLTREFAEKGVSAFRHSSADRDVLQDALAAAARREFDVLLVFKADRLSRLMAEYPYVLSLFVRHGVHVWSVADDPGGRELKTDNLMDNLIRTMEGFLAQSESTNTSIRVTARMKQLATHGPWWSGGRPPYGYQYDANATPVRLVVDPAEAQVIHDMFRWYLDEGRGVPSIVRRLNEAGLRTRGGAPWYLHAVYRIMANPILTGRLAYGRTAQKRDERFVKNWHDLDDVILSDPVPALQIVPRDRWDRAMDRMCSYNRRATMLPRHHRGEASTLLFTGLARCAACGAPMAAHQHMTTRQTRSGPRTYRYWQYACTRADTRGASQCPGQHKFSQRTVEAAILAAIQQSLLELDSAGVVREALLYAEQHVWQTTTRRDQALKRRADAARVHDAWVARLEAFFRDPDASLYPEDLLAARVRDSAARLATAEDEVAALTARTVNVTALRADLERWLTRAGDWWQRFLAADRRTQKALLTQIVERVDLGRDGFTVSFAVAPSLIGAAADTPLVWSKAVGWDRS
jgi:site-specific DNA recombinase